MIGRPLRLRPPPFYPVAFTTDEKIKFRSNNTLRYLHYYFVIILLLFTHQSFQLLRLLFIFVIIYVKTARLTALLYRYLTVQVL